MLSATKMTKKQTARILMNRVDEDETSSSTETEIEEEADSLYGAGGAVHGHEDEEGSITERDSDSENEFYGDAVDGPFECQQCGDLVHAKMVWNGGSIRNGGAMSIGVRNEEDDDVLSGRSSPSASPPRSNGKCSCSSCLKAAKSSMGGLVMNGMMTAVPGMPGSGRRSHGGKKYMVSMAGRRRFRSTKYSVNRRSKHYAPSEPAAVNGPQGQPVQLQLFGEHFVMIHDALCQGYWRRLGKELESEGELALLAKAAAIYEAVGIKGIPKRWHQAAAVKAEDEKECGRSVTVFHHSSYHELSRAAASLSPFIGEFLGRSFDCIVDLSWMDGERHHLRKLLSFLEYHTKEAMPCIATPVRSKKLGRVVPKWYADFALQCDRKDCFIMILIGNGLAIAPLVHLFCARIATMIKALKPNEVREIMALEEDVQKQQALQQQLQIQREQKHRKTKEADSDDNIDCFSPSLSANSPPRRHR